MCAKLASLSLCFVASTGILSIYSCSFFLVEMWDLIWTEGSRVLFTFSYHGPQVETSILLQLKESVFEAGVSHKEAVETSFGVRKPFQRKHGGTGSDTSQAFLFCPGSKSRSQSCLAALTRLSFKSVFFPTAVPRSTLGLRRPLSAGTLGYSRGYLSVPLPCFSLSGL